MTPVLFTALLVCLLSPPPAPAADCQKVFDFLEDGQRRWAAWTPAQRPGGACLSCHTGLSYVLARRAAGEAEPRPAEREQVAGVRSRLLAQPPRSAMTDPGAEAILNLLWLSLQRTHSSAPTDAAEHEALRQFWDRQIVHGPRAGSWTWFRLELDPWDSEHANYFGAALAARAVEGYETHPPDRVAAMRAFLARDAAAQPLHNRLAWAAFGASPREAAAVIRELWTAQAPDGGWTSAALGPWPSRPEAPPDGGSNAYATAWAAFTAHKSGVPCSDTRLARALDWLTRRQDADTGAWFAPSMNQEYPEGSIQSMFMTHAATGYAAAALIACGRL